MWIRESNVYMLFWQLNESGLYKSYLWATSKLKMASWVGTLMTSTKRLSLAPVYDIVGLWSFRPSFVLPMTYWGPKPCKMLTIYIFFWKTWRVWKPGNPVIDLPMLFYLFVTHTTKTTINSYSFCKITHFMKCPGDGFDKEFKTITYFRSCVSIQAIYDFLAMFPNASITLK